MLLWQNDFFYYRAGRGGCQGHNNRLSNEKLDSLLLLVNYNIEFLKMVLNIGLEFLFVLMEFFGKKFFTLSRKNKGIDNHFSIFLHRNSVGLLRFFYTFHGLLSIHFFSVGAVFQSIFYELESFIL